jgi:predicted acetyltransferase
MAKVSIILAKQNDKAEVAFLWKEVFNDSDEFIKLFFDNIYKPENTLVVKRNHQIVSALQIVPYKVMVKDLILDAAYICGVCTRESERGKGLMNRLMNEAMELVRERRFAFSFLIPAEHWLFDVYRKAGYQFEIQDTKHITQHTATKRHVCPNIDIIPCNLEHYPYFNQKQLERKCCILHDYKDFEVILQDNQIDGGQVFVALNDRAPAGMIFSKPTDNKSIVITEVLYDTEIIQEALINYVEKFFNSEKISYLQPHGLACILDKNIPDISRLYMTLMLN